MKTVHCNLHPAFQEALQGFIPPAMTDRECYFCGAPIDDYRLRVYYGNTTDKRVFCSTGCENEYAGVSDPRNYGPDADEDYPEYPEDDPRVWR